MPVEGFPILLFHVGKLTMITCRKHITVMNMRVANMVDCRLPPFYTQLSWRSVLNDIV